MAPLIAAGLPHSALAAVLPSAPHRWIWAVCAVLAVDLVAAGAIRADAERRRELDAQAESHHNEIAELLASRGSARSALAALERPASSRTEGRSHALLGRAASHYLQRRQQATQGLAVECLRNH
jgi:hypothetical protein